MTSPAPNISCEPITLEAVKSRFYHWRTTRTKRAKVPECLWNDVRELSKTHGYSEISSSLGISYPQLHAHLEERDQQNELCSTESDFINADIPFTQSSHHLPQWSPPSSHGTLEIQGHDGLCLKATGLNQQDLVTLVQTFLKR
jgi:hypothetical protein